MMDCVHPTRIGRHGTVFTKYGRLSKTRRIIETIDRLTNATVMYVKITRERILGIYLRRKKYWGKDLRHIITYIF